MYILKEQEMKAPLKVFSEEESIEPQCIEQMKNVCSLPFIHKHVSLMPDAHFGFGASIGAVVPLKGVVIPSLVGVDIGCGMCAVKTNLTDITTEQLKAILGGSKENKGGIRGNIPVGFNHHKKAQDERLMPDVERNDIGGERIYPIIDCYEYDKALKLLGTLGGGNHFIEIQKGSDGHIWIMIHSGSRSLGFKVAEHYNKLAKELNKKWHVNVDEKDDLAFLPVDSEEGQAYIREMNYCVEYALANRKLMMEKVVDCFRNVIGLMGVKPMINIAHNYASIENHFGKNVWVHRKGATSAREGEVGIIPGSQGTKSYIVKGLGNPESFMSCSHGAGRTMSRTKAQKELCLEDEMKMLDDQGILHGIRGKKDLDEAPSAYKDITKVMENQKDLVEVLVELTPLAVVKG